MKNKKEFDLVICIICFISSFICAFLYGFVEKKEIRFISALGFTACAVICLRMFFQYLRAIGFGKKVFGKLFRSLAKIGKAISSKLGIAKDEDKLYVTAKKDEFQIKFELFKTPEYQKKKKSAPKLPRYSSLKTEKEKIRYIYTVFLKKKIERGYCLDVSRTPDEISRDFKGSGKADAIFSCYPIARYASEDEPMDEDAVKELKDIM